MAQHQKQSSNRQRQYLNAMGIDVYISNDIVVDNVVNDVDQIADESLVYEEPVRTPSSQVVVTQSVETNVETVVVNSVVKPVVKPDLPQHQVKSSPIVASTDQWDSLESQVKNCTACDLSQSRTQAVFGVGNRNADWLIIGESPGTEEDKAGEPFVGEAGQLVTKMLQAIDLQREQVYITSIVKCYSATIRHPNANQVEQCNHFLQQQIELIKPKIILVFSKLAAQSLLQSKASVTEMRGRQHVYSVQNGKHKIPLIVTYHPSYLLRAPGEKKKSWNDLKLASRIYKDLLK